MSIELTEAQRKALDEHHGFIEDSQYVLISKDVYRRMMGVGTEELAESLAAIEEGLADIARFERSWRNPRGNPANPVWTIPHSFCSAR